MIRISRNGNVEKDKRIEDRIRIRHFFLLIMIYKKLKKKKERRISEKVSWRG